MRPFKHLDFTARFDKSYRNLQSNAQGQCKKALAFFLTNPDHPSLNIKPITPRKEYWEARINRGDRIVFRPEEGVAVLIDVVTHDNISRWG